MYLGGLFNFKLYSNIRPSWDSREQAQSKVGCWHCQTEEICQQTDRCQQTESCQMAEHCLPVVPEQPGGSRSHDLSAGRTEERCPSVANNTGTGRLGPCKHTIRQIQLCYYTIRQIQLYYYTIRQVQLCCYFTVNVYSLPSIFQRTQLGAAVVFLAYGSCSLQYIFQSTQSPTACKQGEYCLSSNYYKNSRRCLSSNNYKENSRR